MIVAFNNQNMSPKIIWGNNWWDRWLSRRKPISFVKILRNTDHFTGDYAKNISEENSVSLAFPRVSFNSHSYHHATNFVLELPPLPGGEREGGRALTSEPIFFGFIGFYQYFLGVGLRSLAFGARTPLTSYNPHHNLLEYLSRSSISAVQSCMLSPSLNVAIEIFFIARETTTNAILTFFNIGGRGCSESTVSTIRRRITASQNLKTCMSW